MTRIIQGHKTDCFVTALGRARRKKAHDSANYIAPLKFNLQPASDMSLVRSNLRACELLWIGGCGGHCKLTWHFSAAEPFINLITPWAVLLRLLPGRRGAACQSSPWKAHFTPPPTQVRDKPWGHRRGVPRGNYLCQYLHLQGWQHYLYLHSDHIRRRRQVHAKRFFEKEEDDFF